MSKQEEEVLERKNYSENEILSLKDRINHHTTTGLSTVEISSKNADRLK